MASEWREVLLEDVADEITVGHVGSMAREYVPAGVPFLRSQNVTPFVIDMSDVRFIGPDFHARLRKSTLRPGDVVIVRTGKPGTCAVIPEWLEEANCSDLVIVRPGPDLDARFLAYFVNGVAGHHVSAHLVGAVQQHFNVGSARTMRLLLPPLPEQRRIAHILGTLDDKIELNRRMNETLEAMAQALFKSWFVDFDPVIDKALAAGNPIPDAFADRAAQRAEIRDQYPPLPDHILALFPDRFQDSPLGPIPEGWDVTPIAYAVEGVYDGPHATPRPSDTGPVFLGIKNLTGTQLDLSAVRHLSEKDWPKWTRRVEPRWGDIVFCYEARLGDFALIPKRLRCCLGRRLALVRPLPEQPSRHFLFHYFTAAPFQAFLKAHTNPGSTVDRILLKEFPSYPILRPADPVVAEFESRACPLWDRLQGALSETTELAATRDTLLPKLIVGELPITGTPDPIGGIVSPDVTRGR